MEIRCLKTFIQVAERSSFTKAAEALNYTQSTVSSQIKQLEKEFGTQLFERINHTVSLTAEGRALLTRAHEIVNLADELALDALEAEKYEEPVRFAMAPSVCRVMMGETYLKFRKLFPNVFVKIMEADTGRMLEMLNQNDVDLVFLVDRREFRNDYVVVSEKKEAVHFVVSKASALCGRKNIRIEEVLQYPFYLSEKGISYRKILDEKLAARNLELKPVVEMGNTQLLLELVELGGGISFLPEYVTKKSYEEGKIEYLDVEGFEIEIWRQLLYHKHKWLSPGMRKVIAYYSKVSESIL
ncbi:MAG: LysR family transcriptional regulator [Clostridia bacterium]|nr:LysR family transcriptional regulator [Clostridia bacterium]